jgi:hypothetical protein
MDCWPVEQSGNQGTIPARDYQFRLNGGHIRACKAICNKSRKGTNNSKPDPARSIQAQRVSVLNRYCERFLPGAPAGSPIEITGFLAQ